MNDIKNQVIEEIKKIYETEIPVNIYEMFLIYKIKVDETNKVNIDMTLTTPNCPVAESLPIEVKDSIKEVEGVKKPKVSFKPFAPCSPEFNSFAPIKMAFNEHIAIMSQFILPLKNMLNYLYYQFSIPYKYLFLF